MVTKTTETVYSLSLLNGDSCGMLAASEFPHLDEAFGRQISVSLPLSPAEAKRLSQTYEIVVGVRLVGYDHSEVRFYATEATLDAPSERTYYLYVISGSLREVIVRDRYTRSVVKRLPVELE